MGVATTQNTNFLFWPLVQYIVWNIDRNSIFSCFQRLCCTIRTRKQFPLELDSWWIRTWYQMLHASYSTVHSTVHAGRTHQEVHCVSIRPKIKFAGLPVPLHIQKLGSSTFHSRSIPFQMGVSLRHKLDENCLKGKSNSIPVPNSQDSSTVDACLHN